MRAAAKTATYGIMHFVVAGTVAYAITGDVRAAIAISAIEPLVQTLSYTLHERAWEKWWPPKSARLDTTRHAPIPG